MKVLKVVEPGKFEFEERPIPEPGPNEALLRMCYCGICGSDVRLFIGEHPYASYPRIMGHEISARLMQIGKETYPDCPPVTVNPYFTCGECVACRSGKQNCCLKNQTMGVQRDGAYAQYVVVSKEKLIYTTHPSSADAQILALTEPFSVAYHAIERANIQKGDRVLIFGAGPIGVFCGICALDKGAEVNIVDPHFKKKDIAFQLGIMELVYDYYDVCIDACGAEEAIYSSVAFAKEGGKIVLIGHTKKQIIMPHPDIIKKELTIFASRNSPRLESDQLVLIRKNVQKVITNIVPFEEVPEFFKKLVAKDGTVLKALIKF
jgi:threonine dehydrogenase-like Zn-dependent dehydrogenase